MQTFGSNLLNFPPGTCLNTNSKSTAMPSVHPMTSSLDATQWKNSNSIFSTVKIYLRSDSSKKSKLIASLMASGHICAFTKYTFKLNSTIEKAEEEFLEKWCFSQAQYQAADLHKCLPTHLSSQGKEKLYDLLDKHWFLFKGTLGLLPEIKSNAKPFHGCTFFIPKAYHSMIRNEVNHLYHLNVLCWCNESKWAAPSFWTPTKNGQIWFVSDFCQLIKWIICQPYPMPSIHEFFKCFEGFTYCTAFDVNMGLRTIPLDKPSQCLCTIILPWGNYCYLHLPMGLACSLDIYKEKMSELFINMISIIVYQDYILVLTSSSFDNHIQKLGSIFKWLHHNNLQVNAKQTSFCALETEHLGFILTREGIKPQQQKINVILQVTPPCNVKQVWSFVRMLNHYKAMIPCFSHLLTLLTVLTKKNVKFKWTKEHQQVFNSLKNSPTLKVVLVYQEFSVPFEIYSDTSKYHIRSIITIKAKPLAFYSRKLTNPQTRYIVTELKLLAIVETLHEYKCILIGHLITITPITRILPFWTSLPIASLAGNWLLRKMVPTLSTFLANTISLLILSLSATKT